MSQEQNRKESDYGRGCSICHGKVWIVARMKTIHAKRSDGTEYEYEVPEAMKRCECWARRVTLNS